MTDLTPIDRAIAAARQSTASADDFYNLFLNTPLYVPTRNQPEQFDIFARVKQANEGESFTPLLVVEEEIHFLPLFDTLERLQEWARQEIIYVQMTGHAVVEMVDSAVHLILNPGTPYAKEFVAPEVAWLKRVVAASEGGG